MPESLTADALLELLRRMAHDVRSPLASVISTLDMLAEGVYEPLNAKQTRANERARRASRRTLAILDDFITYVKADAGQIDVKEQAFDPRSALSAWCGALEETCRVKGVTLHVTTDYDVPKTLFGPAEIIVRAVQPVLWNAATFTMRGSVSVESSWTRANGTWHITVRDTGPGIPAEHQPHLFEPFWQGDERPQAVSMPSGAPAVTSAGAGLGLAVADALTRLLNGWISLGKTGPTGSTFRLQFPFMIAQGDPVKENRSTMIVDGSVPRDA
ncbi:MAG: HAMP domain-containing histidine kinase [Chloroflexi bacterium]|nr:HAMP domain-containing histidine kinase [Chloroflexota bacterium]